MTVPAIPLQEWGGEAPISFDTPLTMVFVGFFFVLMIGIGLFAGGYQSDEVEYYAAGRRSGIIVIALSGYAAIQSGWGMIGTPGAIYGVGFEFLIMNFPPLGFVLAYWLLTGATTRKPSATNSARMAFGRSSSIRSTRRSITRTTRGSTRRATIAAGWPKRPSQASSARSALPCVRAVGRSNFGK